MLFSEVIGQEGVKSKLRLMVKEDRIPHALLFNGHDGSGTLPLAIAFAQFINCVHRNAQDACGICPSCRKFQKLEHPDLHFSFPVNTSANVSKDPVSDHYIADWRNMVLANPYFRPNQWYNFIGLENKQGNISKDESEKIVYKLNFKSYEAEYKTMIIWLPEKMNASSANMLLKLIEEPPPKTLFFLVTEDVSQLLMTILSRTQPIKLPPLNNDDLKIYLNSKFQLSHTQIDNVMRLAGGSYIKALEAIESSEENDFNFARFGDIMRFCWSRDYMAINIWVEEMSGIGRERLKSFFDYSLRLVRENFMMHVKKPKLVYLTDKESDFSLKFHTFINSGNVVKYYEELNRASNDIERNAYAKIVLFDLAIKIVKFIR